MFLPFHFKERISSLNLLPLHDEQETGESGRKFISNFIFPFPLQVSQRPSLILKEKALELRPRVLHLGFGRREFGFYPKFQDKLRG